MYKELLVTERMAIGNTDGDAFDVVDINDLPVNNLGAPLAGSLALSGSLGIGTVSPRVKLHIYDDKSTFTVGRSTFPTANISITNPRPRSYATLSFETPDPTTWPDGSSRAPYSTNWSLAEGSDGAFGIHEVGYPPPTGFRWITLNPSQAVNPGKYVSDIKFGAFGTKYNVKLAIHGNVGIDVTDPQAKLDVKGSAIVDTVVIRKRAANPTKPKEGEIWLLE